MDNNQTNNPDPLAPAPIVTTPTASHLIDITPGAIDTPIMPPISHVDNATLPDHKVIDITPTDDTSTNTAINPLPSSLSDFAPISNTPPVAETTPTPTPAYSMPTPPVAETAPTPTPAYSMPTPPVAETTPTPTPAYSMPTPPAEVVVPPAPVVATNPLYEDPNEVQTIG